MAYAIVGILVLAFIALVVLSAKAWHWSNIVMLSLVFLAGMGTIFAMAQVLDARRTELLALKKVNAELAQVEKQIETALYGTGLSFEYAPDSLRGLSERLNLEMEGRGRVWQNGTIEVKDTNRSFKFSGARIQDAQNPAAMQDMLLFVYADQVFDEVVYPVLFVGTMRVVGETPDAINLEPVFIADTAEYNSPTTTWTLFEKSPSDQRDAFIRDSDIELDHDAGNLNEKLTEYRTLLTEQYMPPDLFNLELNNPEDAGEYEALVDQVMFNGLPLVKIESWIEAQSDRIAQRFDPANEEIFVRYQFNDNSTQSYDVNASGNVEADGTFTRDGRAVDRALHAGGKIEFKKGDLILVDQPTADGYQRGDDPVAPFSSTEPVTELSRIYVRQLNDYPFLLNTIHRQTVEYEAEITRIARNNERSALAKADTDRQEQQRTELADKLREDQQRFQSDLALIKQFVMETSETKNSIDSSIRQHESDIRENHRMLKAIASALRNRPTTTVSQPSIPFNTMETFDSLAPGE